MLRAGVIAAGSSARTKATRAPAKLRSIHVVRCSSTATSGKGGVGRRRRSTVASAASVRRDEQILVVSKNTSCVVTRKAGGNDLRSKCGRRKLSMMSPNASAGRPLGPELLRANAIAAQYLGLNSGLDPLSSVRAPPAQEYLLERGGTSSWNEHRPLLHEKGRSEALTKLIKTLLSAESNASYEDRIDTSARKAKLVDVTQEPQDEDITETVKFDEATAAVPDEWWEESELIRDQERKQAIRSMVRNANRTHEILFSLVKEGRPCANNRVHMLMSRYRQLVHTSDELAAMSKEESASRIDAKFEISLELYPRLIFALPRHDLVNKMEVLKRYTEALEGANATYSAAEAANRESVDANEDDGAEDSGDATASVRLELDPRAIFSMCDALGSYAMKNRRMPRGRADRKLNQYLLDAVCYLGDLLADLDEERYQHQCLPRLMVSALSVNFDATLWTCAEDIFWYMEEYKFPIDYKVYNHVLKLSNFRNTSAFPFWKVLKVLSHDDEARSKLDMIDVVAVLQNHFPFTDAKATKSVMRSMLSLQQAAVIEDSAASKDDGTFADSSDGTYRGIAANLDTHADRGTLNGIAAAGSIAADPDMVLMAWDLADQAGYSPSIDMYESVVRAFGAAGMQDHNAFTVLAEMEALGISPSRALIKAFGRYVRYGLIRCFVQYVSLILIIFLLKLILADLIPLCAVLFTLTLPAQDIVGPP